MKLDITVVEYSKLGTSWNSKNNALWFREIPYSRLYFPCRGEGLVHSNGRNFILRPGQLLLIPAYAHVETSCPSLLEKYWCHFNLYPENCQEDFFSLTQSPLAYNISSEDYNYYLQLFQNLHKNMMHNHYQKNSLDLLMAQSALYLLLSPFIRQYTKICDRPQTSQVFKAISYMQQHFAEQITLQDLSQAAGLQANYFIRVFRNYMIKTPFEYLHMLRMNKALQFLRDRSKSISDVAYNVGYETLAAFSKSFNKTFGCGPREYRKKFK